MRCVGLCGDLGALWWKPGALAVAGEAAGEPCPEAGMSRWTTSVLAASALGQQQPCSCVCSHFSPAASALPSSSPCLECTGNMCIRLVAWPCCDPCPGKWQKAVPLLWRSGTPRSIPNGFFAAQSPQLGPLHGGGCESWLLSEKK